MGSFSDTIALPSTAGAANVGTLNGSFTVTTAGNYQVTLSDFQLPQALIGLTLAIATEGGGLVPNSTLSTATGTPTASASVALQPGVTYRIFAGGQADTSVNAGLYGVSVSPGSGAPVYSNAVAVGTMTSVRLPR